MRELLLATIADQPDIEIVGEVQNEADVARVVAEKQPDFLIVALDDRPDERPSLCDSLLQQFPAMRILALAPERNRSIFLWASLDIHSNSIEASEEGILSALRSNVQITRGQP